MSEVPAVQIKNLSKSFKIPLEASSGIKQKLIQVLQGQKGYREFSPLNDISFTIEKGDFFGILGKNGSGKSTLLKTIAGIYAPNEGTVEVDGTLIPFIELGVGFNPELSGRENVYLNGALLGFSNDEVDCMYRDIVDFAELGEFMEERLKNFSSGMQVRLAFSIAIRANGDILLLDEILAVGDAKFQQKCYDYFHKLKDDKKTVIFISHDIDAIQKFCNKVIYLKDGKIVKQGNPQTVADEYMADLYGTSSKTTLSKTTERNRVIDNLDVSIINKKNRYTTADSVDIDFSFMLKTKRDIEVRVALLRDGIGVAHMNSRSISIRSETGKKRITFTLQLKDLIQGLYSVNCGVNDRKTGEVLISGNNVAEIYMAGRDEQRSGSFKLYGTWQVK